MKKAVLFDFHNTLATCDGWLELEIRTLPALALARLADSDEVSHFDTDLGETATQLFLQLRDKVRQSGQEISALEGVRQVLGKMRIEPSERALEDAVEKLELSYLPNVEMTPGAEVAIRRLYKEGYRLGIVSGAGYHPFIEQALEQLGLLSYFSAVLTSSGEQLYKSDPQIYHRAVQRLGIKPAETVHIGDHVKYDVAVPRQAGLATVWFAAHARSSARLYGQDWEEVARAGKLADATVYTMEELPDVISAL